MSGLGILCPGQGNQHPAMFDMLAGNPAGESVLQAAAPSFGCHPREYLTQASTEELFRNRTAQRLIATSQMAIWAVLRDLLPAPLVFAGYSLGEVIAYGCADALKTREALELIDRRAAIMDAVSPSSAGLLAIRGLGRDEIDQLCRLAAVDIAIINTPDHYVLGGSETGLRVCEEHPLVLKASQVKRLPVEVPSHTPCLRDASRQFESVLQASSLRAPYPPVLAGVDGAVVRSREQAVIALTRQVSQALNWMACLQTVIEMGCRVVLELGPGNALTKMLKDLFPEVMVRSVDEFRSLQGVATWVEKHCS